MSKNILESDVILLKNILEKADSKGGYFTAKSTFSNQNLITLEVIAEVPSNVDDLFLELHKFQHLHKLIIDRCDLDSIPNIANLDNLSHIEFNNCNIKGTLNFNKFPKNTKVLSLLNNDIDSFINCKSLKKLKHLYIQMNNTESIDCAESLDILQRPYR